MLCSCAQLEAASVAVWCGINTWWKYQRGGAPPSSRSPPPARVSLRGRGWEINRRPGQCPVDICVGPGQFTCPISKKGPHLRVRANLLLQHQPASLTPSTENLTTLQHHQLGFHLTKVPSAASHTYVYREGNAPACTAAFASYYQPIQLGREIHSQERWVTWRWKNLGELN